MCSGIARLIKGSHSSTCTPRIHSLMEWTIPAFTSQLKLVLIYRPLRDGRLSWPRQPEMWVNSRPRTATQCLSWLLTGQIHLRLSGQIRVSGLQSREALQNDLDLLFKCSEEWQMNFSVKKCKVMHIRKNNMEYSYTMSGIELEFDCSLA